MNTKINNEHGMSLIELMIASSLLVIGMLANATFMGTLITKNGVNEKRAIAATLAQEKIEDLKNDALLASLTAADNGTDTLEKDGSANASGMFTRTWTIDDGISPKEIAVTVSWDGVGTTDVSLKTLINN